MNKQRKTSHILNVFQYDHATGIIGLNGAPVSGYGLYLTTNINDGSVGIDSSASINALYLLKNTTKQFEISYDTSGATKIFRLLPYQSASFFQIGNPSNAANSNSDYVFISESVYGNVLIGPGIGNGTGNLTGATASIHKVQFNGAVFANNSIQATSFKITGGASTGFLKADGTVDTVTYLSGNQSITVSGDATGSGTTSIALTLANTAVTPGTYGSTTLVPVVTVDSKGRITSVTTAAISGSLTFTGDVTGSGTTGTSTAMTLAASGVTAGTYTKVTVDSKGRVTVGASATTSDISEGTNLYYTDARVLSYLSANTYATQSYVNTQVSNLVAAAPATLDTLNELAAALGNDPSFATTISTALGNRLRVDINNQGLSGTLQGYGRTNLGLGTAATSNTGDFVAYRTFGTAANSAIGDFVAYRTFGTAANNNTGDFATAAQGTKADTAFGWGNHASAGYLTSATAATTYVSLTGSYANPAWITSLGWSKITSTPTTISGYGITNAYTDAQIQNFFNGANAISGYNKSNWDTAYSWGNHAVAGYLTTASAASTYVSLTGSYANPSWITSLAYSKITGVPAFLTSYTETDPYRVTTVAVSGTSTKTITLTRADASTVTTTWTDYDTDTNTYVTSAGFSGGTLTLTRNDAGTVTVSLDGRYYLASNPSQYITGISFANVSSKPTTISGYGITDAITTGNIASQSVSYASSTNLLNSLSNYVWSASTLPSGYNAGIQTSFVSASEGFPSYGSVLTNRTYTGSEGGTLQLFTPYGPAYGGTRLGFRSGIYETGAWSGWKYLLNDSSDPYAANMNQYVRTTDNVNFNTVTISGKITTAVTNGTIISHGSMTDAFGYNNSYGTYIGSVVGGTYYIYGNGQMYNNGTIVTLYHTGNIPTWNQNTTGTAGSISGFNNPTTSPTANTIMYRDGSGYVQAVYYYSSNAGRETTGINSLTGKTSAGAGYMYEFTAAAVQTFLGLGSMAYVSTSSYLPLSGGTLTGPLQVGTSVYATHWNDGGGSYIEAVGGSTSTRKLRLQSYNGSSAYAQWFMDGGNMQIYGDVAGIRNFVIDSTTAYIRHNGADKLWGGSDGTRNSGWAYHNNNDTGLHWPNNGWHLYPSNASDFRIRSGSSTDSALRFETAGTVRGYVYAENDNTIGFLNNSRSWSFRTYANGNATVYGYLTVNGAGTSSSIYMNDSDEGQREIHCNSNRIGFLTQAGYWGAYCDDAGNFFAANLSGTNTGDQTNISGNAATATNVAWSGVTSKPTHLMYYQSFTLDANTMDANSTGFTYSVNAPFTGPIARFSTGGSYDMWLGGNYGGSGNVFYIRTRNGDAGTFNPWRQIITDGNIGSQTVASASNATTAGGLAVHTGTNNNANQIVRTDANGYIQAGWINSISGNMGFANRIARITCSDDQYMRFQTLTEFKVSLGMSGKNDYSRRIDYTSDANYHVGSFGHGGAEVGNIDRIFHYGSGFFDVWSGNGTYAPSTSHIHGFNALHYTTGYGGNAYGWQMASQYNQTGLIYARWCSGGSFSAWQTIITSANIGSQSVSYATTAGSANSVAWTNVSSRPTTTSAFTNDSGFITSGSNVVGLYSSGFGNGNFTWYQSPGGLQQYGGSWASFLISNHGAGVDYYNQTIIMPFWGAPQYMRKEGNVNVGPWTFYTTENLNPITTSNIGSQSVSYASTSGTAARATRSNGQFYIDDDHGCSVIGVYSSYRFQGVYSMGSAYVLPTNGTTPGNLYGMAWSHPNAGGQATRLNDHGLLVMINGVTQAAISSNIWAAGDVTAYSDARVKENIEVINNAIEKIQAIRGVTFTRNDMTDTTTRHAGVIAQEVLEVLPEVITKDANDHYSVAYGNLNALLIEAIKEQQLQIEELKNKLDNVLSSR